MPTIKERIWTIVKDSPGVTYGELCVRLSDIPKGSLASQYYDLIGRGIIYQKPGTKVKKGRFLLGLHTDQDKYVLTPLPRADHVQPNVAKAAVATTEFSVQALLDPLTMGQARQLYKELHKIFGAR